MAYNRKLRGRVTWHLAPVDTAAANPPGRVAGRLPPDGTCSAVRSSTTTASAW